MTLLQANGFQTKVMPLKNECTTFFLCLCLVMLDSPTAYCVINVLLVGWFDLEKKRGLMDFFFQSIADKIVYCQGFTFYFFVKHVSLIFVTRAFALKCTLYIHVSRS